MIRRPSGPSAAALPRVGQAPETDAKPAPAPRHDGWTPARQAAFLRELAATQCVGTAAKAVGMSRQSAYRLRARLRGEPFDLAWDAAFQMSFDALAEAAMERALHGTEVPVFFGGEQVGSYRRYDERLTLALLNMKGRFLRPRAPSVVEAGGYAPDDVAGLLARVGDGPERWSDSANADRKDGAMDDDTEA